MSKTEESTIQSIEKRTGYKKTKLGWIPKDWEVKSIGQFAKCQAGGTPKTNTNEYWENGIIPWMSSGELNLKRVFEVKGKITEKGLNNSSANIIPKHSVLIGLAGQGKTRGTAAINEIELATNQSVAAIIPNKELINYEYLYYNLDSRYQKIRLMSTGDGGRGGLNLAIINSIKVPIPSIKEQRLITDCLTTWDLIITQQTQLIEVKMQLKKGLLQQLLTGKKRLPGFEKDWKINRFDFFLDYTPRPVQKPEAAFIKLGIRSHCKGTFQNLGFEPEDIAIDTLYLVKPKDLIVNITFAWEGAVAIVKDKDAGALVSHRFPTYTFKDGISDTDFFKQFIQSKRFRYLLELISPGGAGRNRVLSKKELSKLKIKIPPYDEQVAIAKILKSADQEIELLEKHLKQLKKQKKGLMQQLLTGKKRLKY